MKVVKPPKAWPEVAGIALGGCVVYGEHFSRSAQDAHAHNYRDDECFGWICFEDPNKAGSVKRGRLIIPYFIAEHEYAHILVPDEGHTAAWLAEMDRQGFFVEEHYRFTA